MKLNENGDFCLLYVEPADERRHLFTAISEQKKPVVLLLPQSAGQPRSRLFQHPEDFNDLKHIRRQTGVPIIFLTASSELLAQMAARHGFPSYPSIDALAEVLARGKRASSPQHERAENEYRASGHKARTGPLQPATQIAAIRRPMITGPLPARAYDSPWPSPASGSLPVNAQATEHTASDPRPARPVAHNAPPAMRSGSSPTHAIEPPAQVATVPLNPPPDLAFWPAPENANAGAIPVRGHATPLPPGRVHYSYPDEDHELDELFEAEPHYSEIPRRRSAQISGEPYTHHPGWEPDEEPFEQVDTPRPHNSGVRGALNSAATRSHTPIPEAAEELEPLEPMQPVPTKPARQRRGVSPVLIILSLLILAGAGLGSLVMISHATPNAPLVVQSVGSITFLSSEQLNQNTSQGIDDEVQITLRNLGTPAPGKSFYAWLLGDKDQSEAQSILLGKLNVVNGSAKQLYAGDAQHTNLLQIASRFLVTEEDSGTTPLMPSPDTSTWRYDGAFPTTPDPNDPHHYSFLNHLRHLLADEPILDELELPGGLNNWFTRNTQTLIQWTTSARDDWQNEHNLTSVRDKSIQILSYLDGMSFLVPDLPAASARVPVTLDGHLAALGLINVKGSSQNPPSYMEQMIYHLNGLLNAPGSPANVRHAAAIILPAMSAVETWLNTLRSDDKQLLAMTNTQMQQAAALSLLDDMVLQASNAYSGTTDPTTGKVQQGVVWIHQQMQSMATMPISSYVQGSSVPEIGPASPNASMFVMPSALWWRKA